MDDLSAAGARWPDSRLVLAAIKVAAPLVLSDEGHQGGEGAWHGAGTI